MRAKLLRRASMILSIILALSFLIFSCTQPLNNPNNNNNTGITGYVTGKVVTTNYTPVSGITVSNGNVTAITDAQGGFFLSGVPAGDRVLINFKSDNYASTQKIVTVQANRTTYVDASVLAIGIKQNLNAATGGTVSFSGAKVDFPANSLVNSAGSAFTGTANVHATYFDPTNAVFYGCFPGDFIGTRTDNSETQIESYGFINVEILNGTEKLQLASGKQATITLPIPAKLQGNAPASIPLWYYDETQGKWLEQGSANKVGNTYVGTVSHFSSWNCDMPTKTSYLQGKVVDKNGDPVSFATVHSAGVDYTGSSRTQTDDNGSFKIAVKANSTASIWASYYTFSSTPQNVATPDVSVIQDIGTITIPIDTMNICTIIGRAIDNGNFPVPNFMVYLKDANNKILYSVATNSEGKFKFFADLNTSYTVEFKYSEYDTTQANTKSIPITTPAQAETMDLGDVQLDIGGSTIIGRVLDSTGTRAPNVYVSASVYPNSTGSRSTILTDSLGKFSLWVKPNITFKLYLFGYWQSHYDSLIVTSPNLGETKDLGDIKLK